MGGWLADLGDVSLTAEAVIDLAAIRENTAALGARVSPAAQMAVVKSDGYGHGMVQAAGAALAGGASWLGVISVAEALGLREAGFTVPVLCLLDDPAAEHAEAITHGIDLTAGSVSSLRSIAAAAAVVGQAARVHLKADTGMTRGGANAADWPSLVAAAARAQADGLVDVIGICSHFASSDEPGSPAIGAQLTAFKEALVTAEGAGITPRLRHIANTAAAIDVPESHYDLVRIGGGVFGLSTLPGGAPRWLRPAMTLRARLAQVKRVPAGSGVSYGAQYVTTRETTIGIVPLGYADGIPRTAIGQRLVFARGRRWPVAGRVCMDQLMIDFGDEPVAAGDEVIIFGPGDDGEPTAQEWGETLGTISYEIVTGISGRVPRSYP